MAQFKRTFEEEKNVLIINYLTLRKIIGLLGFSFPFILAVGGYFIGGFSVQRSVSYYYYTNMRDVFVGVMFAISLFMFCYKGYQWYDNLTGNIAGICALLVALLPTAPASAEPGQIRIGNLHLLFAGLLFVTLAVFSLFLFTKTDEKKPYPRAKRIRNGWYIGCGIVMIGCILGIFLYNLVKHRYPSLLVYRPVYIMEAFALFAFGISWLIKGETLLKDPKEEKKKD